jgi:hypothetical protein
MYQDFMDSVWNKQWLLDTYEKQVVQKVMTQGWAIDELNAGVDVSRIEDLIWSDYESWALDYLDKEKTDREVL